MFGLQYKASGIVFDMAHQPALAEPHATAPDDYSPFNHTITFAADGSPDWVQLASGLWVMSFDGNNDYADCGSFSPPVLTTALTIEVWVYTTAFSVGTVHMIGKDDGTNRNYVLAQSATAPAFTVWIGNAAKSVVGDTTQVVNTWYHQVGVFNGSTVSVCLNGASDATPVAAVGVADDDTVNFTIGTRATLLDRDFTGSLGLIRVYNYPLSEAAILKHYTTERWWFGV